MGAASTSPVGRWRAKEGPLRAGRASRQVPGGQAARGFILRRSFLPSPTSFLAWFERLQTQVAGPAPPRVTNAGDCGQRGVQPRGPQPRGGEGRRGDASERMQRVAQASEARVRPLEGRRPRERLPRRGPGEGREGFGLMWGSGDGCVPHSFIDANGHGAPLAEGGRGESAASEHSPVWWGRLFAAAGDPGGLLQRGATGQQKPAQVSPLPLCGA